MSEIYNWIQSWYLRNCDGDWEHQFGIVIETLDNPGWSVTVDLEMTALDGKTIDLICRGVSEEESLGGSSGDIDWLVCKTENNKFIGYGGPRNLARIIQEFKIFSEKHEVEH
jgi:hypothetical protein